jgi:hypothetical protein
MKNYFERVVKMDAIVVFAFGRRNNEPSLSNIALVNSLEEIRSETKLPVIAQLEVSELTKDCISIGEAKDHYVDTYEVALEIQRECIRRNWKELIVIAHADHLPRCCRVLSKMGFKVETLKDNIPYDSKSLHWQTRNRFNFCSREILVWVYYFIRRWV